MLQQACTSLSHLSGTLVSPQPCTSLSHLTGTLVTPQPCTSILSPPLRGEGLGVGSFSCCQKLLLQRGRIGGGLGVGSFSCCHKLLLQRWRMGGGRTFRWFLFPAATSPSPKGGGWEEAGLRGGFYFLLPQAPPPKGEDGRGLFPSQRTMRGYSTYIYDDPRQILTPKHKKIEYLPEIRTKCPSLPHLIIPFATPNLP